MHDWPTKATFKWMTQRKMLGKFIPPLGDIVFHELYWERTIQF